MVFCTNEYVFMLVYMYIVASSLGYQGRWMIELEMIPSVGCLHFFFWLLGSDEWKIAKMSIYELCMVFLSMMYVVK